MPELLYNNNHITIFPDFPAATQKQCVAFQNVKQRLWDCSLPFSMLYPARFCVGIRAKYNSSPPLKKPTDDWNLWDAPNLHYAYFLMLSSRSRELRSLFTNDCYTTIHIDGCTLLRFNVCSAAHHIYTLFLIFGWTRKNSSTRVILLYWSLGKKPVVCLGLQAGWGLGTRSYVLGHFVLGY